MRNTDTATKTAEQSFQDAHYEGETRTVQHGASLIRQTFRRGEWWNEIVR